MGWNLSCLCIGGYKAHQVYSNSSLLFRIGEKGHAQDCQMPNSKLSIMQMRNSL